MYNNRSLSSDHDVFNRTSRSFQSDDYHLNQSLRRQQSPQQNQSCYVHLPYSSPIVNGKKNNSFINPSLSSNEVFYDHDYGYVNDMPNDRLLSPVKHDKFGSSLQRSRASADEQPKESSRSSTRNELVQSRQNYFFSRDAKDNNRDDVSESGQTSQRRRIQLRSADGLASQSYKQDHSSRQQELSNQSYKQPELSNRSYRQELSNSRILIQEEKPQRINNDDARSTKSTKSQARLEEASERSTVSSKGDYRCPNCLNQQLCHAHKARSAYEKQRDRLEEVRVLNASKAKQEKEDIVKMLLKSKKAAETRKLGDKIEESYQQRLEDRRSPPRGPKETEFRKIFDAQDQRTHMRRVMSASFNNFLLDQIDDREYEKRAQRFEDTQFYNTSLQLGNNNYNKYLDDPETVLAILQDQVEDKAYQKKYEKESEVRMEQELLQRNLELQAEEYYRKQEEDLNRKKMYQASFNQFMQDKKLKQKQERERKTQEKFYVDKGYANHKRMLQEDRQDKRAQAFDLQQEIKKQQVQTSYTKRYEERRQQKTLTSFDPKPRIKNLVSCGGCYNVYEKAYMTKYS